MAGLAGCLRGAPTPKTPAPKLVADTADWASVQTHTLRSCPRRAGSSKWGPRPMVARSGYRARPNSVRAGWPDIRWRSTRRPRCLACVSLGLRSTQVRGQSSIRVQRFAGAPSARASGKSAGNTRCRPAKGAGLAGCLRRRPSSLMCNTMISVALAARATVKAPATPKTHVRSPPAVESHSVTIEHVSETHVALTATRRNRARHRSRYRARVVHGDPDSERPQLSGLRRNGQPLNARPRPPASGETHRHLRSLDRRGSVIYKKASIRTRKTLARPRGR